MSSHDHRRILWWTAPLIALLASTAAADSRITGTVDDGLKGPVFGVRVSILDAQNAELVASTISDPYGFYDSGAIPSGDYRVRFSTDSGSGASKPVVPEFLGAGADDFCQGSLVTVPPDVTVTVDFTVTYTSPTQLVLRNDAIGGLVVDGATGDPLAGIQVTLLRSGNAQPIGTAITDAFGKYQYPFEIAGLNTLVVRFSDPGGAYLPEYDGAGGLDDFCQGTVWTANERGLTVNAALTLAPPEQVLQGLTDAVEDLALAGSVESQLQTPLTRSVVMLTDGNPNNDGAVCNQLESFITRVDIQESKGQLTQAEADALRVMAQATQSAIGCQ